MVVSFSFEFYKRFHKFWCLCSFFVFCLPNVPLHPKILSTNVTVPTWSLWLHITLILSMCAKKSQTDRNVQERWKTDKNTDKKDKNWQKRIETKRIYLNINGQKLTKIYQNGQKTDKNKRKPTEADINRQKQAETDRNRQNPKEMDRKEAEKELWQKLQGKGTDTQTHKQTNIATYRLNRHRNPFFALFKNK